MTLYCVRMSADHPNVPDEIVGIFSAKSLAELYWLVDEVWAPMETEYAVLPSGGIMGEGRGPKLADLYRWDSAEEGHVSTIRDGEVTLSARLQSAFEGGLRWHPMPRPKDE